LPPWLILEIDVGELLAVVIDIGRDAPRLGWMKAGLVDAEPPPSDHRFLFMVVTLRTVVCVAAIVCFADTAPAIAKKARLICDYAGCWQAGPGYEYPYGYRPSTKSE
jgi:hypothetical protein